MTKTGYTFTPCTHIFERIKKLGLPKGQYAVFGSSLLDVMGIRPAGDLDVIVTPKLFQKLKDKGYKWEQWQGIELIYHGEAEIATNQTVSPYGGSYMPDREKLIKEAVFIEGCPFVRIEEVITCKADYNREKDRKDIAAINKYLAEHPGIFG